MPNTTEQRQQILAGPILRRMEPGRLVIWLASQSPLDFRLQLSVDHDEWQSVLPVTHHPVRVGEHCYLHLLSFTPAAPLPQDQFIEYDLQWLDGHTKDWHGLTEWAADAAQPGQSLPRFVLRSRMDKLLHGSCRKPHHASDDGMVTAANWLAQRSEQPDQWPGALLLSGDQVYVDDVAGPMLTAIHQLINKLGLYPETIEGALVNNSKELFDCEYNYYRRGELLPDIENNESLQKRFFEGARKPVFTSANADNHLVTFAEVIAMYLLVWSPVPWEMIDADTRPALSKEHKQRYERERRHLRAFVSGLGSVRQLLAQLPTLMIFDDHDITDDWNLTADWEQTAYGHPFSRRIIGNALFAYLLCQGWGNNPDAFEGDTMDCVMRWCQTPQSSQQNAIIEHLLGLQCWHYSLDTSPKLLVLDTRTRRWRSETNLRHPSGLMDWEALSELQNEILNHESIIMVSPAPVFGVKLIEAVQKVFTWLGKPLMVDAENWMAHPGTANVILNIFRHARTPRNYVILSGDVHYSFVYGIRLRSSRTTSPHLWQITSSGIKNCFPDRLLDTLDRLNRWLYAPRSPLNWFTRRRPLEIIPYRHSRASRGERLFNASGMGYVEFDSEGKPVNVEQITPTGSACFKMEKTSG